jgi:hypothetical protein
MNANIFCHNLVLTIVIAGWFITFLREGAFQPNLGFGHQVLYLMALLLLLDVGGVFSMRSYKYYL